MIYHNENRTSYILPCPCGDINHGGLVIDKDEQGVSLRLSVYPSIYVKPGPFAKVRLFLRTVVVAIGVICGRPVKLDFELSTEDAASLGKWMAAPAEV